MRDETDIVDYMAKSDGHKIHPNKRKATKKKDKARRMHNAWSINHGSAGLQVC